MGQSERAEESITKGSEMQGFKEIIHWRSLAHGTYYYYSCYWYLSPFQDCKLINGGTMSTWFMTVSLVPNTKPATHMCGNVAHCWPIRSRVTKVCGNAAHCHQATSGLWSISAVSPWVFGTALCFCDPSAKSKQHYRLVIGLQRELGSLSSDFNRDHGVRQDPWPCLSASGIVSKRKLHFRFCCQWIQSKEGGTGERRETNSPLSHKWGCQIQSPQWSGCKDGSTSGAGGGWSNSDIWRRDDKKKTLLLRD